MYKEIEIEGNKFGFYYIGELKGVEKLPFSIRILLENLLRYREYDKEIVSDEHIEKILLRKKGEEIPFFPERVILQDFTGVPLITDIAVMRDVVKKLGYNPRIINPVKRCELVIDHSVQVDFFGTSDAFEKNVKKEFERNRERYIFLKWAQNSFENMQVIPPGVGIIHQVNLEHLADVVMIGRKKGKVRILFPDTLLGTDSHTTMINALGVLGWGVGGIEAEAVMLGEPYYIVVPEVTGVKLIGEPKEGVTATDIVLTITQKLREKGVVDKFVEFFGEGVKNLSLPDRATISNMCPEYGARCALFIPDEETVNYLKMTARPKKHIKIVEAYLKENLMFSGYIGEPEYDDIVEIRLDEIEPCTAGPSRPHDRIPLRELKERLRKYIDKDRKKAEVEIGNEKITIKDADVIISAITSCTNTSNPYLMIAAGLLAKKAVEKGLRVKRHVKTSNAPGSRVVTEYLERLGLMPYLSALGFHITGYGCTVCIGNSGPINSEIERVVKEKNILVAAVLSGNRNFEARIHPIARANFLMSPPLVVAFAIAGTVDINVFEDPIGYDPNGHPVYLKDIWPTNEEIKECMRVISPELFRQKYKSILDGTEEWKNLPAPSGDTYEWDEKSTYIKPPPFFDKFELDPKPLEDIKGARVLLVLGDTITTDHISPAGRIHENSPAGKYLMEMGVKPDEFDTYGARRGNWMVMARGTFANIRIKNLMVEKEGGYAIHVPTGRIMTVFEAAELYKSEGIPLVVIAGKEYGSGSSRDWAAKGTALLGVKAVIAESFEVIHRSNLIGMGVIPLEFKDTNPKELKIDGKEIFNIPVKDIKPGKEIEVEMIRENGERINFKVIARVNTQVEVEYIKHGGILPYVLRKIVLKHKLKNN